jgi:2-oxoglutarate dehydrogenase E2 component (dihydrolipoamide succinyltransferase)
MPTPVVMPQMGESVAEGTIVRWMKKVGEAVDLDEPLFEISTDKVDAEIPAPTAGILLAISVHEGETVAVNSVVGTIGTSEEASAGPLEPASSAPAAGASAAPLVAAETRGKAIRTSGAGSRGRRQRSSPLVRRLARAHSVDVSAIQGSGLGGRVTKSDLLGHVDGLSQHQTSLVTDGAAAEVKPLSIMRRKIAEHMVLSRRTSAHVHSVFHVDFSRIRQLREQQKAAYEQQGARLTYMAFIVQAVAVALREFPVVNASLDAGNVVHWKDVNIGIAVALDTGLLVPVIRHADEQDLLGLSRAIADVAERARTKQLRPEEVQGGTFTITNHGQFGSQFGLPIINQPQVAILGVGAIEKRAVVIDDAVVVRTMAYLTLGYDHRLIDGATGEAFMSAIKHRIETFDDAQA